MGTQSVIFLKGANHKPVLKKSGAVPLCVSCGPAGFGLSGRDAPCKLEGATGTESNLHTIGMWSTPSCAVCHHQKRGGGVKDYMTYRVANLMSCEIYGQEYIAEMCKPIRIRVKRMKDA